MEVAAATVAAASLVRLQLEMGGWMAWLTPAPWLYLPFVMLSVRRLPIAAYGFAPAAWQGGARWLVWSAVGVLLPVALVVLAGRQLAGQPLDLLPARVTADRAVYELLFVAIPEELFFRGYAQTLLSGSSVGRGRAAATAPVVLTTLLFALAHVVAALDCRRAAVFFPGLVMGWLRQRTGGLLAPAGFHWLANLLWLSLGR